MPVVGVSGTCNFETTPVLVGIHSVVPAEVDHGDRYKSSTRFCRTADSSSRQGWRNSPAVEALRGRIPFHDARESSRSSEGHQVVSRLFPSLARRRRVRLRVLRAGGLGGRRPHRPNDPANDYRRPTGNPQSDGSRDRPRRHHCRASGVVSGGGRKLDRVVPAVRFTPRSTLFRRPTRR